jgi:hypothetical protein
MGRVRESYTSAAAADRSCSTRTTLARSFRSKHIRGTSLPTVVRAVDPAWTRKAWAERDGYSTCSYADDHQAPKDSCQQPTAHAQLERPLSAHFVLPTPLTLMTHP